MQICNASKMGTLGEDVLRLLDSLRFIAGPETEDLIQLAQSLFALLGDVKEYLIWHVRSRNLFRETSWGKWLQEHQLFVGTCPLESASGEPLLFKKIVINST